MGEANYRGKLPTLEGHIPPKPITNQTQTLQGASSSNNPAGNRATTVGKEINRAPNVYAKSAGFKCYRCGQSGHHSNECPARRPVNLIEAGEDVEEETEIEELLEGAEIAEEQREFINCGERMYTSSIGKGEKLSQFLNEAQVESWVRL
ncbi:hypothetical protein DKX38_001101 [Salix brachista]|uniref:CCHC-type domain-containing protein n=1 Tax=Salix brachista TaxID=2182728 RepID=A0A5N5P3T3_9ROSI|nr:hypothetical protein DKX38_001101 [Salix brachista]